MKPSRSSQTTPLDGICAQRGKPTVIRSDNGPEFTGQVMRTWAHRNGIALSLIEPGKPNQNAYVDSFNGRLSDGCLTNIGSPVWIMLVR